MKDLLPAELLQEILDETGATGKGSHLVKSVRHFKPFEIKPKGQAEFSLATFEEGFDQLLDALQRDWKKNFVEGCEITRRPAQLVNLKKYKFREESIVTFLNNEHVQEPFTACFGPSAFALILNQYLGGGQLKSERGLTHLTSIEASVMERICASLCQNFSAAFAAIYPTATTIRQIEVGDDIRDYFKLDYLFADFNIVVGSDKYPFSLGLPLTYLKFVKKQLDKQDSSEQKRADPAWQKAITGTVLEASVDLKINVGEFVVPFETSLNLKVGDVFPWEKYGPQVLVSILDRPRMIGTIGAIGENYAIKVDELLS